MVFRPQNAITLALLTVNLPAPVGCEGRAQNINNADDESGLTLEK